MNNVLIIVLAVFALFVAAQLYVRVSTFRKKGKAVTDVPGKLGKEINQGKKLLLYFYTHSCAACKSMTPLIDKLSGEHDNVRKVNLGTDMDVGRKFGVMATPTLVLVEDGIIKSFLIGAKSYAQLKTLLEN